MREQEVKYDCDRYRHLLAEAVDEGKRLALIELLIKEKARDQLAAHEARMTTEAIARVLGTPRKAA